MKFTFELEAKQGKKRAGKMQTPHGEILTPIFMPVGTQASVKALDSRDIEETKAAIILANTYHLYLRPGEKTVASLGGVQKMMRWGKPMLTDSGGFQVFSLGEQLKEKQGKKLTPFEKRTGERDFKGNDLVPTVISEEGVEFTSHLDGSKHFFSPKKAIEIQQEIGADIIMAFDECTPDGAGRAETEQAVERTFRWAKECKEQWERKERLSTQGEYQALFGIVQGAMHEELRKRAAEEIVSLDLDGVAIGGETIGYNMEGTKTVMGWIEGMLPENKPRYAMGLGRDPQDIIDAIEVGFDMFDCVAPTRLARNGALYNGKLEKVGEKYKVESEFSKSRLPIGNSQFILDEGVIQEGCDCYTCKSGYTRGYLHHLYKTKELGYYRLASIHNVRFMIRLCEEMRRNIVAGESEG